jgi:LSD1 subclass zinc finger protein
MMYALLRIADLSGQLPPSIMIHGVTLADREMPRFSGGLADIFLGTYKAQQVAIKRVRIVGNVDRTDLQRVCMPTNQSCRNLMQLLRGSVVKRWCGVK